MYTVVYIKVFSNYWNHMRKKKNYAHIVEDIVVWLSHYREQKQLVLGPDFLFARKLFTNSLL